MLRQPNTWLAVAMHPTRHGPAPVGHLRAGFAFGMSMSRRRHRPHREYPLTGVNLRLAMVLVILFIDITLLATQRMVVHGTADETAHVFTALLWGALALSAGVPMLLPIVALGGMFPDLDHVPMFLVGMKSLPHTSRSVLHTLLVILIFVALAWVNRRWRWVWGSMALGVASHLARDMATGTVILFWPLSGHPFTTPYLIYMGTLVLCVLLPAFLPRRTSGEPADPVHQSFVESAATARHHRVGVHHMELDPAHDADNAIPIDRPHPRELTFTGADQQQ